MTHRYGENGFRLFRLPAPREEQVVGILGPNGMGKSTAINLLSGALRPNLGDWTIDSRDWTEIIESFPRGELRDYLTMVAEEGVKIAVKPQYIDKLPKIFEGKARELLDRVDDRGEIQAAELDDGERGGLPGHWMSVLVSYADPYLDWDDELIQNEYERVIETAFPQAPGIVSFHVIRNKHATTSLRIGAQRLRPDPLDAGEGVILGGDWIDIDWPSTMEGASRAGLTAAAALLEQTVRALASFAPIVLDPIDPVLRNPRNFT